MCSVQFGITQFRWLRSLTKTRFSWLWLRHLTNNICAILAVLAFRRNVHLQVPVTMYLWLRSIDAKNNALYGENSSGKLILSRRNRKKIQKGNGGKECIAKCLTGAFFGPKMMFFSLHLMIKWSPFVYIRHQTALFLCVMIIKELSPSRADAAK